ncbi:MAG: DUF3194 domain-containing protein [Candidatus Freyarchaeota archaeon]|nr:DUF3194 domain-containing protein [Candidatus Freyrarchaeum guaymaensis]
MQEERKFFSVSEEEIEEICNLAERAARRYVLSRCRKRDVIDLKIVVSSEIKDEITFNVDLEVQLSPLAKVEPEELAQRAAEKAIEKIEERLRDIAERT